MGNGVRVTTLEEMMLHLERMEETNQTNTLSGFCVLLETTFSFKTHALMTHLWHCKVQNHLNMNYCVFLEIFDSPVQILCRCSFIPKSQVTCNGGACWFSFSSFFKVVSATKSSHLATRPLWTGHTLLQILTMLHTQKRDKRQYLSMRIPPATPWHEVEVASSPDLITLTIKSNIGPPFPLSVYPRVFLTQSEKHLGAKWRVSGWMRRTVIVILQMKSLYEERPSAATYQNWIDQFQWWKKRNCPPVIMKTEAEQVNQKNKHLVSILYYNNFRGKKPNMVRCHLFIPCLVQQHSNAMKEVFFLLVETLQCTLLAALMLFR